MLQRCVWQHFGKSTLCSAKNLLFQTRQILPTHQMYRMASQQMHETEELDQDADSAEPSQESKLKQMLVMNDDILSYLNYIQTKFQLKQVSEEQESSTNQDLEIGFATKLLELKNNWSIQKEQITKQQEFLQQCSLQLAKEEDKETLKELQELTHLEIESLQQQQQEYESQIMQLLMKHYMSKEEMMNERNAMIEIRQGAGGDEAGLFALELFQMYERVAQLLGWKSEKISLQFNNIGGCKEGTILLSSTNSSSHANVFEMMKFESGVHRVQRVPSTEKLGRVHTSTVTVAVLPELEDVDVKLNPKDLKMETMRASGAGGQHVNTTDSAVRITHVPTGVSVHVADERSQHQNKEKALKIIRSRLYEVQRKKAEEELKQSRSEQVGSGMRNEKIRTYNYPQDRVTDHRIGVSKHGVEYFMKGDFFEFFCGELIVADKIEQFKRLLQFIKQQQSTTTTTTTTKKSK